LVLINLIAETDNSEISSGFHNYKEFAIKKINSVQKWHICQKNCICNR